MERESLEHQFFTWEGWNEVQTGDLQFFNVELIAPVGKYSVGTKFPTAFVLASQSMLVLMDENDQEHAYELVASVGRKLDKSELPQCSGACDCGHEH